LDGFPSIPRMADKAQRLEVTLETVLESVDLAESVVVRVAAAAGFGEEDVHKIGMAVREAVVNAYNYGNQQDRRKKIVLTIEFDPERMAVHVLDEGRGFDVKEVPDCLAEENLLRTSGRGLFLMRAFMDEFIVQRGPEGGAELVMVKNLPKSVSGNGKGQQQ
jgi:serine/threonine-protein kinase RsbW